jgi:hypothetical protein
LMCRVINSQTEKLRQSWMNLSGKLNSIMTSFLELVDYPDNYFQCCKNPKIVCVDGIVLSIESKRILRCNLTEPWRDLQPLNQRFTTRPDRNLIKLDFEDKETIRTFIYQGNNHKLYCI